MIDVNDLISLRTVQAVASSLRSHHFGNDLAPCPRKKAVRNVNEVPKSDCEGGTSGRSQSESQHAVTCASWCMRREFLVMFTYFDRAVAVGALGDVSEKH